jgi:hypothetical protein
MYVKRKAMSIHAHTYRYRTYTPYVQYMQIQTIHTLIYTLVQYNQYNQYMQYIQYEWVHGWASHCRVTSDSGGSWLSRSREVEDEGPQRPCVVGGQLLL